VSTRTATRLTVAALLVLAAAALSVGIPATIAPGAFYNHYPFIGQWVDRLPPYNQHLVTDVGEFELAFGLLFLWSARSRHPALLGPVCLVWALSQTVHAIYHATHLGHFPTADAAGEMLGFFVLVALALAAIWLSVQARRAQPAGVTFAEATSATDPRP
jgi:L-ascorbate metabolism protein UlaG (beta-lactamase superfamily)